MVDRGGLENRCTLAGTQGSNPCLSAIPTENHLFTNRRGKMRGKIIENAQFLGVFLFFHRKNQARFTTHLHPTKPNEKELAF